MIPAIYRIDGKTPRSITLYVPVLLALLFGLTAEPGCTCAWPEWLGVKALSTVFVFLFSWPFVLAFYYGFCFFRGLICRPRPALADHTGSDSTHHH